MNISTFAGLTAGAITGIGVKAVLKNVIKASTPDFDAGLKGKIQKASLVVGTYAITAVFADIGKRYVETRAEQILGTGRFVKDVVSSIRHDLKDEPEHETVVINVDDPKTENPEAPKHATPAEDIPDTFKNTGDLDEETDK